MENDLPLIVFGNFPFKFYLEVALLIALYLNRFANVFYAVMPGIHRHAHIVVAITRINMRRINFIGSTSISKSPGEVNILGERNRFIDELYFLAILSILLI